MNKAHHTTFESYDTSDLGVKSVFEIVRLKSIHKRHVTDGPASEAIAFTH